MFGDVHSYFSSFNIPDYLFLGEELGSRVSKPSQSRANQITES